MSSGQEGVSNADRVEALISGLEGYEASFEHVSWTQEYYIPPTLAKKRPHWLNLERSRRYADRSRRWFMDVQMLTADPPDYVISWDHSTQFGDGAMRVAANAAAPDRGIQGDNDGFFQGGASLLSLQGRFVEYGDFARGRLASAILRSGERTVYLPPTEEEPWPGVRSEGAIQGYTDLEMRLDPAREFMPCVVRTIRHHDGAVGEVLSTLVSRRVRGISVPVRGIRAVNVLQVLDDPEHPASASVLSDFAAARTLAGLEGLTH